VATREELHAILDELDSDQLPDPEAFRRVLLARLDSAQVAAVLEHMQTLRGSFSREVTIGPVINMEPLLAWWVQQPATKWFAGVRQPQLNIEKLAAFTQPAVNLRPALQELASAAPPPAAPEHHGPSQG
jgi:hypothetical protein